MDKLRRGAAEVFGTLAEACRRLEPSLRTLQEGLDVEVSRRAPQRCRPTPNPTGEPSEIHRAMADRALRRVGRA
jgi:hypothetical protein